MQADARHPKVLRDAGPLHYDGVMYHARIVPSRRFGSALKIRGPAGKVIVKGAVLNKLGAAVTVTCWVKVKSFPQKGQTWLIAKGNNEGFQLGISNNHCAVCHGFWGGGWYQGPASGKIPTNQWVYLALAMRAGGHARVYLNGKVASSDPTPYSFWPNKQPLQLGGGDWAGELAAVHIYAATLTPRRILQDMQNKLVGVKPVAKDFPPVRFPVQMILSEYDMPIGNQRIQWPYMQPARRQPGPDAVDWPKLWLNGNVPLWRKGSVQYVAVPLAKPPENMPLFREPYDNVVEPVDHWFRALPWLWGRYYVYTTDRSARTSADQYELWAFPVRIVAGGTADIHSVRLRLAGRRIYHRVGKLHSLTLLLPANPKNTPYSLRVDGRGPVRFSVGLKSIAPGDPRFAMRVVHLTIRTPQSTIEVRTESKPPAFPNRKQWHREYQDMQSGKGLPAAHRFRFSPSARPWYRRVGVKVPVSPESINAVCMTWGMSGGFYFSSPQLPGFHGTLAEYARHMADMGFDRDFELVNAGDFHTLAQQERFQWWINDLRRWGVQGGINADGWVIGNPNLAFYSYNLPEFHRPVYRDLQLLAQRFDGYRNFVGLMLGADNAGYVPYWNWAPPIPNRPWGRAFINFQQQRPIQIPVGPGLTPHALSHELNMFAVRTDEAKFLAYIHRYNRTWRQYGYFAQAVKKVDPRLMFTTGSFGSAPGVGGRGGFPWASIPARPMEHGVPVLMAYNWNELNSARPLSNVALVDRLRSDYPRRPIWSLIDNFRLFMGRQAQQRAYALVLTRGVQAVGTNFLAQDTVPSTRRPRKPIIAAQKALFKWIHKYGGVYAHTHPIASIGILYDFDQAISRPVVMGKNPSAEALYHGSQEGQTTEAMFLCDAAGWPARIITPTALRRGLPKTMKAILLVGLNRFDKSWVWYQGLTGALQKFVNSGGRILRDDQSVCPGASVATGMRIAAYVAQTRNSQVPLLLERNRWNMQLLRRAMKTVDPPIATSSNPTIWTIPTRAGDVKYVTVVNWGYLPGHNADVYVKPQVGRLHWHTHRPIYDVRLERRVTPRQAGRCDLTHDAFQWYALPPARVTRPELAITVSPSGGYVARVVVKNPHSIRGIPVQLTVSRGTHQATVYSATGLAAQLPLGSGDPAGRYKVRATELLSGLSTSQTITVAARGPQPDAVQASTIMVNPAEIAGFARRRAMPLVLAMTPKQKRNPKIMAMARGLLRYYRRKGRKVHIKTLRPGAVVVSLHWTLPIQPYPQWRTISADLILLGSVGDNLLIYDEARGGLLPVAVAGPALVKVTQSPFDGGYDVLNVVADTIHGLKGAVHAVESPDQSRAKSLR